MANYFVINNKFKPYSFDELIKPYQMYAEEYDKQEAALSKLESDAATVESALSKENDPIAYNTYNAYINEVRGAAEDIAKNGLSINTRNRARALVSNFNSEILPIQAAYNRRKELQDEQRKALLSNPTLYFQRNFNQVGNPEASIDRFVENPNYDYGNFFSGALLEKQVSDIASTLSKELTDYGKGKPLDSYTNTFLQQHGFTKEQVLEAINNPGSEKASPVLTAIVDSVIQGSGVPQWGDANALMSAYRSASRGLFSAVGQTSVSTYDNYGNRLAAQKRASETPTISGIAINPLKLFSQTERTEAKNNIDKYRNRFFTVDSDGKVHLTDKGKTEVGRSERIIANPTGGGTSGGTIRYSSDFQSFVNSITSAHSGTDDSRDKVSLAEQAIEEYLKQHESDKYDARRTTEFDYKYDPSEQQQLKSAILATGATLQEVDYDPSVRQFVPTDKPLSAEDLQDSKTIIESSRMTGSGTTAIVVTKDGKRHRIMFPRGINTVNEKNRDLAFQKAEAIRDYILQRYSDLDESQIGLLLEMNKDYQQALREGYLYQSQIGFTNKTKSQEFKPFAF